MNSPVVAEAAVILTLQGIFDFVALNKPQSAPILWLDRALKDARHPRVQELIKEALAAKRLLWRGPFEFNMYEFTVVLERNSLHSVCGIFADAAGAKTTIQLANDIPVYC